VASLLPENPISAPGDMAKAVVLARAERNPFCWRRRGAGAGKFEEVARRRVRKRRQRGVGASSAGGWVVVVCNPNSSGDELGQEFVFLGSLGQVPVLGVTRGMYHIETITPVHPYAVSRFPSAIAGVGAATVTITTTTGPSLRRSGFGTMDAMVVVER
jgi:hypothetical protein